MQHFFWRVSPFWSWIQTRKGLWERWKDVLGEGVTHDWWTRRKLSYRLTQADGSVQLRRISWTGSPDKLLKNNFMDLEDALFRLYVARALCWENNIVLLASCARKRKDLPYLSMNTRKFIKKFDVNLIKLFFLIIIISIVLKRDQWCIIKRDVIALLGFSLYSFIYEDVNLNVLLIKLS